MKGRSVKQVLLGESTSGRRREMQRLKESEYGLCTLYACTKKEY
jgi:hypothetical protein